jgi:bifunctional ADP-heptose synthase (sugar kinase/adenylyltransferase)
MIKSIDGIIILDQVQEKNCGVVTDRVFDIVERFSIEHPSKLFFADSREHGSRFKNVMVKCNMDEAKRALTTSESPDGEAFQLGKLLFDQVGKPVFITLGADGILCQNEEGGFHIPALDIDGPIDIVGAGDSVMAAVAVSMCSGATFLEAASIGMITASIIIQQIGTTGIVNRFQILSCYQEYFSS